ncbi:MAG: hypothetical protein U0231_03145 [Nitrospiraceae bacterium]
MRHTLLATALGFALLTTSGCNYLFYPHAKEFAEKAKGADSVDTAINLTTMLEASAKAAQPGKGVDQPWTMHNQFRLRKFAVLRRESQAQRRRHALAVTHHEK